MTALPHEQVEPTTTPLPESTDRKTRSLWGDAARTFARNKAGVVGLCYALLLLFVATFASVVAPYDPNQQDWAALRKPPSAAHIMGTDEVGRDVFSRIVFGTRTAILVAVIITGMAISLGILFGGLAAFLGGWVDLTLGWVIDTLLNFPGIWLAAFVAVTTRPIISRFAQTIYDTTHWEAMKDTVLLDYLVIFGVLGFFGWAGVGRLVRGQVLSLREKEFIDAQHAIGAPTRWIIMRHIVPNLAGSVIVAASFIFGGAMLAESSLSFLGIGIRPPGASWGTMISSSIGNWRSDPHLILMPGIVLSLAVLSFNFIGDALNDALNPRARK